MRINAEFDQRVIITPDAYRWVDSPVVGVQRMMLDRIGAESGHATSLVRYAPGSTFPRHTHAGGEEILVLEGEFGDEHGLYPAGTYLRNPIGTSHTPRVGEQGALIFVKLHQFAPEDKAQLCLQTSNMPWYQGMVAGLSVLPLHDFEVEHVALVRWAPNTQFSAHNHFGGEEILVLDGTFHDEHGSYPKGSWLRSPHLSRHQPYSKEDGALIYVKTGHLMLG